eukprot:8733037-Ditylum_brightwellii.AAC.1
MAGGDRIMYPDEVSMPSANTSIAKFLINGTILTGGAQYTCADLKNFYLGTPMERQEFMQLPLQIIPQEILEAYNLTSKVHNGKVYIQIKTSMYGIPQAKILANKLLTKRLAEHGYPSCQQNSSLWKYDWRPISFTLVVDDFGIKY